VRCAHVIRDAIVSQIERRDERQLGKRLSQRDKLRVSDVFLTEVERMQFSLARDGLVYALPVDEGTVSRGKMVSY
jgi:hypothetical protein